ncbi:MAG: GNAT family N-acetyltransferase [Saprospiraceae bacterium]|nr:GNAT family N-acetyltransferase [Saprospiraceae bacterium]
MPKQFTQILETDRLLLRPFVIADIEPSYQINLDPRVSRYTHDGGVKTREEIEQIIHQNVWGDYQQFGFGRFAVIHKKDDRFIGFAGLKYLPEMDEVDIGYRFHPDYWGQGIATECGLATLPFAFETLRLDHLIGMVLSGNSASQKVLEKLHFSFEKEFEDGGEMIMQFRLSQATYRQIYLS